MHSKLIEQYDEAPARLGDSIKGLNIQQLLAAPDAAQSAQLGKWPIQSVVLHIVDADLVITDRIKRVIAEDNPTLLPFDESAWANHLHYASQSAHDAVVMFRLNHQSISAILKQLADEAFERSGTHTRAGKVTLTHLIQGAVDHMEHHVKYIIAKREALLKK